MVELVFYKVAEVIICHFTKSLHSLTPPKHCCVVEYGLHHRHDIEKNWHKLFWRRKGITRTDSRQPRAVIRDGTPGIKKTNVLPKERRKYILILCPRQLTLKYFAEMKSWVRYTYFLLLRDERPYISESSWNRDSIFVKQIISHNLIPGKCKDEFGADSFVTVWRMIYYHYILLYITYI